MTGPQRKRARTKDGLKVIPDSVPPTAVPIEKSAAGDDKQQLWQTLLQRFAGRLTELRGEIAGHRIKFDDELEDETLAGLVDYYLDLDDEFDGYLQIKSSTFYAALERSPARTQSAKDIQFAAQALANYLEECALEPRRPRPTQMRRLLQKVYVPVCNLLHDCQGRA